MFEKNADQFKRLQLTEINKVAGLSFLTYLYRKEVKNHNLN